MGIFSGITDAIGGAIKGFTGGGGISGAVSGALGGLGSAADSGSSAYMAYKGIQDTNAANAAQADKTNAFNAAQAEAQRNFNAQQSNISRDWDLARFQESQEFNAKESGLGRDFAQATQAREQAFNAEQAQLQRDYETNMSNTSYQRAVKDMQAAGLNPMLAYQHGGASTPTGASASSSGVSAGNASVGSPTAGAASGASASGVRAEMQNAVGAAINTGMSASRLDAEMKNMANNNDLIQAQTAHHLAQTNSDYSSAYMLRAAGDKIAAEIPNIQAGYDGILADSQAKRYLQDAGLYGDLKQSQVNLNQTLNRYYQGQVDLNDVQRELVRSNVILSQAAQPGALAEARKASTGYGQFVAPYVGDAAGVVGTMVGLGKVGSAAASIYKGLSR